MQPTLTHAGEMMQLQLLHNNGAGTSRDTVSAHMHALRPACAAGKPTWTDICLLQGWKERWSRCQDLLLTINAVVTFTASRKNNE